MAHWFKYWKEPQIRTALDYRVLDHVASDQLDLVDVGDTLWIVNVKSNGKLTTIGPVAIQHKPLSPQQARRRLIEWEQLDPETPVWPAKYHVILPSEDAAEALEVDLSGIATQLTFDSNTRPKLAIERGRINAQQLQRMRRLSPESARLIQETWEGASRSAPSSERRRQRQKKSLALLDQLDKLAQTHARKEQSFVRDELLGGADTGTCALCGEELPVELLVAAHVKRRAECSDAEKRDYRNNVVPMCKLGCDDLFERGFLIVDRGVIKAGRSNEATPAVQAYSARLHGKSCGAWNAQSAEYFMWHRSQFRGGEDGD